MNRVSPPSRAVVLRRGAIDGARPPARSEYTAAQAIAHAFGRDHLRQGYGGPPKPDAKADESRPYCSVNVTVTVITTGTGTPLSSVGV
jgi:hypothetical protein